MIGSTVRHKQTAVAGSAMIELLIGLLIVGFIGSGAWTLMRSGYDSQYGLMNQNSANSTARQAIDYLADHVRGATALSAATAADLTFTDSSGAGIRYWKSGTLLKTTTNGLPSGGSTVLQNLQSLGFTYWTWNGTQWASSTAPGTPAQVGAIDVTASVTWGASARQVSSSVRVRQIRTP